MSLLFALLLASTPPAPEAAPPTDGDSSGLEMSAIVLLPPSLGVTWLYPDQGSLTVSVPWYLQFGTVLGRGSEGSVLRRYQVGLEGTLGVRPFRTPEEKWDVALEPSAALGFRFRWPGESRRWAAGAWSRVTFLKTLRFTVEPEAVLFLGPCCRPGSVEISARLLWVVRGPVGASLRAGFSYW